MIQLSEISYEITIFLYLDLISGLALRELSFLANSASLPYVVWVGNLLGS